MTKSRADTNWTTQQIEALPVEQHFRLRGVETTRLDTLVDAAFAFTLTMLVFAEGGVPKSFDEITEGLFQLPALVVSFAILMMFWFAHRKWSRRYGIETTFTVIVSVSIVFVLLVYIYPLRLIFEGMISFLSGRRIPWGLEFSSFAQVRGFFAFYAAGFLTMSLLMSALYYSAIQHASTLMLDEYERMETENQFHRWLVAMVFSLLSIFIAMTVPIQFISASGFIFFVMLAFNVVVEQLHKRKLANLQRID